MVSKDEVKRNDSNTESESDEGEGESDEDEETVIEEDHKNARPSHNKRLK